MIEVKTSTLFMIIVFSSFMVGLFMSFFTIAMLMGFADVIAEDAINLAGNLEIDCSLSPQENSSVIRFGETTYFCKARLKDNPFQDVVDNNEYKIGS